MISEALFIYARLLGRDYNDASFKYDHDDYYYYYRAAELIASIIAAVYRA